MDLESLAPDDHRVEHKYLSVGDHVYHYMLAEPEGQSIATVILIHGWYGTPFIP
ncbi:hypothetical protein GGS20DRAFT_168359 [Poronia punctata]|nr:hypothetical protein GGS20DRAFT_168359 [Poronia punctata]